MRTDPDTHGPEAIVVGGGPAGLACAAELSAHGVPATVLEQGPAVGAAWASRYDGLRFNTSRRHSALPGAPFPRAMGQFATRDAYVAYLADFARSRGVRVELGREVTTIERADRRWLVRTRDGTRVADDVVVATGIANRPALPSWATGETPFRGPVLHSAAYRAAAPFAGKDVVVVGAGSSGMEVAGELARGGARRVHLSVRTPPNLLPRSVRGLPTDLPVPLLLRLPTPAVDAMMRRLQRAVVGDLAAHGLPEPAEGAIAGLRRRGAGTAIVDLEVLDAVRDGSIHVVPAAAGLRPDGVLLTDGTTLAADAVVLATGFTPGLDDLVGHLGVLDERGMPWDGAGGEVLPGLRFVGYVYRPGLTGYVGRLARRVARDVARRRRDVPVAA